MAQVTQLMVYGIPGMVQSFSAKTATVVAVVALELATRDITLTLESRDIALAVLSRDIALALEDRDA